MSHLGSGYDINKTFIIETISDTTPVFSACTGMFTNAVISCTGDTRIIMGDGIITFDGNIYTNDDLSATTINASTYFSGGTNVFDIINDLSISGGTYDSFSNTLTLTKNNDSTIIVTGFSSSENYYTTGTTVIGNTVYFDRTDSLSAYTLNLSSVTVDTYVTGVTFSDNQLIIVRNDGVNLNTFINSFTGLTINGLLTSETISATTISADTFFGDGSNLTGISTQDTFVTGGTYSNGTAIFTNNTGDTFNITGFSTGYTLTESDIISTLGFIPLSSYTDTYITGGTYNDGTLELINNSGGTINISGFITGSTSETDIYVTGGTYSEGVTTFTNNTGGTFTVDGYYTGGTLPTDTYVTGGTYSAGTAIFTNTYGDTFNVSGFFTNSDDVYTTGVTVNNTTYDLTIFRNDGVSFTANLGILASDVSITGGTYNPNSGIATFTNTTGGTFNVDGFLTGQTDTYVTGLTYSNNILILNQTNNQADISVIVNTMTGLTVNGELSATTYLGLPPDVFITGATYSGGTAVFTNSTGGTFDLTGLYTGETFTDVYVTGGTYSAGTATFVNSTGGTFDITGLYTGTTPQFDVFVTGGTYSDGTTTFVNSSGGTFNITGYFTGGTNGIFVTGPIAGDGSSGDPYDVRVRATAVAYGNGTDGSLISDRYFFRDFDSGSYYTYIKATDSANAEDKIELFGDGSGVQISSNDFGGNLSSIEIDSSSISSVTTDGVYNGYITTSAGRASFGVLDVTGGTRLGMVADVTDNSLSLQLNDGTNYRVALPTNPPATGYTLSINSNPSSGVWGTKWTPLIDGTDVYVTGGTFNGSQIEFTNTTGGTFDVTGFTNTTGGIATWSQGANGSVVSGTTTNSVTYTQLISGGTMGNGNLIRTNWRSKWGVTSQVTKRIYINTTPDLTGTPILVGTYNNSAAISFRVNSMTRTLVVKDASSSTETYLAAGITATDLFLYNNVSNLNVDWTVDQYIIFALQNSSSSQVSYGSFYLIEKI